MRGWLAVASPDVDRARRVLQERDAAELTDDERRIAETVVDFDAEETVCPACESRFATAGVGASGDR